MATAQTEAALVGEVDEMLVEAFVMPSEILVRVAGKLVTGDQRMRWRRTSCSATGLTISIWMMLDSRNARELKIMDKRATSARRTNSLQSKI